MMDSKGYAARRGYAENLGSIGTLLVSGAALVGIWMCLSHGPVSMVTAASLLIVWGFGVALQIYAGTLFVADVETPQEYAGTQ